MTDKIINIISPLERGGEQKRIFYFLKQHPEDRLRYQTAVRKLHTQYESSEIPLTSRFSQLWLLVTLGLGLVKPGPANNLMGDLAQNILFPPHPTLPVQQRYWPQMKYV